MDRFGKHYFANGKKFEGDFRKDKKHGNGLLFPESGDPFQVKYYNGNLVA